MKPTLELLAVVVSLLTFAGGVIAWYSASVQKRYASQRDFEHLKRNYEQLASNQNEIVKDLDKGFDSLILELKEVKGLQTAILVKISPSDSVSDIYRRSRGDANNG